MKKILAFGASSSKASINQQLAVFTAGQIAEATVTTLDMNDFEMPLYSVDREGAIGVPEAAKRFKEAVKAADGIIISFAEHNGSYAAVFKNLYDWASRVEKSMWQGKPMFLLATSPGGRGGITVLEAAKERFSYMDGKIVAHFSLPSFQQNFSATEGITEAELKQQFEERLAVFVQSLTKEYVNNSL